MDLAPAITTSSNTKSPEADSDTPSRILPSAGKSAPFSNGVLKRHQSNSHHNQLHINAAAVSQPVAVTYRECLKNHAASLGAHALDGCGEFMPSPSATSTDPTSLKCAACGCHRNFHRREPEEPISTLALSTAAATHVIEYQPHHRHHPPPPPLPGTRSPNSSSPPPISSSYYPSAPHMLLALSTGGLSVHPPETATGGPMSAVLAPSPNARKRFRTKFSHDQKEKMLEFAERLGWKMQKRDEDLVQEFCNQVGVERGVLKVWMHNNKNTMGKKVDSNGNGIGIGIGIGIDIDIASPVAPGENGENNISGNEMNKNGSGGGLHIHHHHDGSNGSSSSS